MVTWKLHTQGLQVFPLPLKGLYAVAQTPSHLLVPTSVFASERVLALDNQAGVTHASCYSAENEAQQGGIRSAAPNRQGRSASAPVTVAVGRRALPASADRLAGRAAKAHEYPSGHEDEECVGGPLDSMGVVAAVVSVAFNRPDYLRRHAASLLAVHGSDTGNMCAILTRLVPYLSGALWG